jgi:putative membrane protein
VKGLIVAVVVTAVAFAIIVNVLPNTWIEFTGEPLQLILLSLGVGVVNAVVKPIVKALSFPINLMTLGLFGLVINTALILAIAWVAQGFASVDLTIGGWPTSDFTADAIIGAIITSVALSLFAAPIGFFIHD